MKRMICRILPLLLCLCACAGFALADDAKVTFSLDSGFYAQPMSLRITCDVPGATVYYTTDGSVPDETDKPYTSAIPLSWTTHKTDYMARITEVTLNEPYIPPMDFPSGHIIRAVAVLPDGSRTSVISGTYLVGYDRQALYGDTPIVFLATDPDGLFNYDTGIYVAGKYFDEWVKDRTEPFEAWEAQGNFTQRGSEWERPVSVTFLPAQGEGFTQDMGMRIKGGASRGNSQKSLRLIARDEYGKKNVKYAIFPDNLRETDGEVLGKYKSFTLRNGGNDCDFAKIRDPYIQRLATGMRFETAANRPVIAFLNGEYWGMYTLNEEYTDNYIEYHYGINSDNVITVKTGEVDDGRESDFAYFKQMFDHIAEGDMADPRQYARACELLDMGSFADYVALQLYIYNEDGIFQNNNWEMWRVRKPGQDDSPYADGRWRMMVYDTDYSSGIYNDGQNNREDNLTPVLTDESYQWRHPGRLVQSLLKNDDFRQQLITALCDVRNLYFAKDRAKNLLDEMTEWYLPYVPDTLLRFGPQWVTWDAKHHFSEKLKTVGTFFTGRHNRFPDIMKRSLGLGTAFTLTFRTEGEGQIIVNGRDGFPLTSAALLYFPECRVTVTAVPAEGKRFVGWKVSSSHGTLADPTAETTTLTFDRAVKVTAVFE